MRMVPIRWLVLRVRARWTWSGVPWVICARGWTTG
uniref:Uncharacterized protein n=1 Tax=Setaria viridis TaxID=4556 RepID=A0A4U6W474_SETVI|nr:hypothetical protein SEVIR_2G422850v2 [Setaria viridis]